MTKSVIFAVVCAVSGVACDIKSFDGCDDDDSWSDHERPPRPGEEESGGASSGGSDNGSGGTSSGGSESSSGGTGASNQAGSAGSAGTAGNAGDDPTPTPCTEESDCPRGFNCDDDLGECVPADAETCPELHTETACDNRNDCVTTYAGTNCSCGPECACIGGEPGCVCESFAFFECAPVEE